MISQARRSSAPVLAAALALILATSGARAAIVGPVPAAGAGPAAGGVVATGVIAGIAAFLGIYDFARRTTCSGDPLRLGGPGFTSPIRPSDNVMPPRCPTAVR